MSDRPDPDLTPEDIEAERAPDNVANEKAISRKRVGAKAREALERETLSALLMSPGGRSLLRTMLFVICGVDNLTDANAVYDANGLHYKAGGREAGMRIRQMCINADRTAFITLMAEELADQAEQTGARK